MAAVAMVPHPPASKFIDVPGCQLGEGKVEVEEDASLWVCTTDYEQSAAAALLGLHTSTSWGSPQSPESPLQDSDLEPMGGWGGAVSGYSSPGASSEVSKAPRLRYGKDGAPPPGTTQFRCRFPGCRKVYASTDAVRKHCRKRHLEWLRKLDSLAAHDRQLPKPALYCEWGDD
ncbi:hypothetical protein AB1Y20_011429 [Prymnesium parvum]|uniref:C2H2-type domain-containing protein n=1 Tax=Prymnesium parvum TaxID=97485 RepID=A0AB34IQI9_PRYPA